MRFDIVGQSLAGLGAGHPHVVSTNCGRRLTLRSSELPA